MKKFLFGLVIAMFSFVMTSCNTQFGIAYGVHLNGDGDGQFEVTFPQGSYAMDGKATFTLNVGDTVLFGNDTVTTKAAVLQRNNKKELAAMQRVNDSIANEFNAFAGEGTYDLYLKGFVKEMGTGLVFEIDRHFTNRENTLRKAPAVTNDPYPYIK